MSAESNPPARLMQRIEAGDRDAIKECVRRYGTLVWSIARRLSPDREAAEIAVREIFEALAKNAGRFDAALGSEPVFVTMMARQRLIERVRTPAQRPLLAKLPSDVTALAERTQVDPAAAAEISADAGLAAQALGQLSAEHQLVLKLSILLGLSNAEIAAATALPVTTVKTHIRRGLLQIRKTMVAPEQTAAGVAGIAS